MILPGRSLITSGIIRNVRSAQIQTQPCGVDLTLRRVLNWTSPGTIDFENRHRRTANATEIPFIKEDSEATEHDDSLAVHLSAGAYLVEFNETVKVPLDRTGQLFVRSSLFRSGAMVSAGVMDSGYQGAVGALLQVLNPYGLILYRDARLAQFVFHRMSESVEGYQGVYQGRTTI
jgi:dUTP pyrophosphatase